MSTKRKEESAPRTMGKSRTKRPDQARSELERDSGFSDTSSEHFSVVDQAESYGGSRKGVAGKVASRPSSQPSQLAVVGGFSPNLSPMIIMNNVLLKQPGDNPPAHKPWSFSPTVEMVQQPQVVFLQPVVSARAPSEPSSKRRRHKKYLPILKSYPKIAPHPGDSPSHSSSSSSSTSSSSSYSSPASSLKSCSLTFSHHDRHRRDRKGGSVSGYSTPSSLPSSLPASPLPHIVLADSAPPAHVSTPERPAHLSRSVSVPAANRKLTDSKTLEISRLQTPTESGGSGGGSISSRSSIRSNHSRPSSPGGVSITQDGNSDDDGDGGGGGCNKRKRFCNTYNILSKSGLLDITLRTKELIRQNRRTQGELDRLREHTSLFMEVLRGGDASVYERLQSSMLEEDRREKSAA